MTPMCSYPGCDAAADVWYKGPWCAAHAEKKWGSVIGTLSRIEASRGSHSLSSRRLGNPSSGGIPSSGRASGVASVTPSEPAPLSDAEVEDLLKWEMERWTIDW